MSQRLFYLYYTCHKQVCQVCRKTFYRWGSPAPSQTAHRADLRPAAAGTGCSTPQHREIKLSPLAGIRLGDSFVRVVGVSRGLTKAPPGFGCALRCAALFAPSTPGDKTKPLSRDTAKGLSFMPVVGVEPTRCHHQRILSPSRLPIPTHRLMTTCLLYPEL